MNVVIYNGEEYLEFDGSGYDPFLSAQAIDCCLEETCYEARMLVNRPFSMLNTCSIADLSFEVKKEIKAIKAYALTKIDSLIYDYNV